MEGNEGEGREVEGREGEEGEQDRKVGRKGGREEGWMGEGLLYLCQ